MLTVLLDQGQGVLYVSAGSRVSTVFIGTLAERREARYYPVLRTWALMQDEAAEMIPATATESADETRARKALRLLMDFPIADVLVRTLTFLYH